MATARPMSPGGALLRSSRMFSLPPALTPPANNVATAAVNRSETATAPFPTLQSITTPSTSRIRGDWGFKRPFPLKSTTKTSTPLIRVRQVDTVEQVTDFASAADHTVTLQKFHEMNVPVFVPTPSRVDSGTGTTTVLPRQSVFEEEFDVTAIDPEKARLLRNKRWKFTGPWLAGMAEGEFKKYVKKQVAPRRAEFREWLRGEVVAEMNEKAAARATELGEAPPAPVTLDDIGSAEVTDKLRKLREDRPGLFKAVGEFLDLAPISQKSSSLSFFPGAAISRREPGNPYSAHGPPITHPSAGISYLRTNAFIESHPVYGPQARHRHVRARVLMMPKTMTGKVGVGGFIADNPGGDYVAHNKHGRAALFDPSIEGGRKMHVEPHSAVVDSRGMVKLTVNPMSPEAAFVARELDGEDVSGPPPQPERAVSAFAVRKPWNKGVGQGSQTTGSSAAYGLGGSSTGLAEGAPKPSF